jgi:8-oxo-dGTP pyrophosphatase MutT (NUDIX family)
MPPPTLTRRPLKCDGPPPQWVSNALNTAQQVKVLTLAIPARLSSGAPAPAAPPPPPPPPPPSRVQLLLGAKKRGFGAGKINGFGGKLEPGESTDAAAARELREESGLTPKRMAHVGVLTFVFDDELERPWSVHVYGVASWSGEPAESDEMAPAWFDARALPFGRMWADDRYWYPRFVEAVAGMLEGAAAAAAQGEAAAGEDDGDGNDTTTAPPSVDSAPCFEGVFGFSGSTHEMAWAGLWALERPGERSAVADEAAGVEDDAADTARRADGGASSCPWLPAAPLGGDALAPESLAHLARAAGLARATAAHAGGKPTAWRGWPGAGGEAEGTKAE